MTSRTEHWHRVRDIFDRVADLPAEEWEGAVTRLVGDDAASRREVMELLTALREGGDRLEEGPPPPVEASSEPTEPNGIRLGSYRLLREVGEGGMGRVYEAVRDDAQFEKRVAIKIVHEVAGDAVSRRFRQERQILAVLDHPHIARLLDGGVTGDGRPYLVMEYVDGEPLTTWCETRQLGLRDRLALFLSVCEAVQYAHRHLVVHRDLKPGNILVTPEGDVKLLDFGIAKLLPDPTLPGRERVTATVQRPFTPAYASPEQVRGQPVSTATDVYSLGVILYELLTGRNPFELEGRSPLELMQLLETEPMRPSEAVTDQVTVEGGTLRLRRALTGELDNIILMAMRKEPARRYGSVEQLADDVRRFLGGRPVLAQRDTWGYRTRKFASRHRAGVAAAGLVAVSLLGGIATTAWQARRAGIERDRARLEARKAERINAFLTEVLRSPDPWASGRDVRVTDLLAGAASRATQELAAEPEVLAEVQTAIGMSWAGLGSFDSAQPLLESALRIRRGLPNDPPSSRVRSLANLAGLFLATGDLDRAEPLLREALATIRVETKEDSILYADLHGRTGSLLQALGQWEGAAREHEEVLALRRRLLGPDDPDVAESLNDLAVVRGQQGQYAVAEALLREALGIMQRAKGADHPDVAAAMNNIAFTLGEEGRFEAADSFYRASLALRTRVLGPEHPDVAWTLYAYASMLHEKGDYRAAELNARRVLALRGRTLPDAHPLVSSSLQVLGRSLAAQGRPAEAEGPLRESLALRRASLPARHWLVASAESVLGECLASLGRSGEAEPLLVGGYEGLRDANGPDNPRTLEAAARVAHFYLAHGDTVRAARYRTPKD
jgi:serine/threonine protein kinase/tetratricopeptide (TPR) repeat protein